MANDKRCGTCVWLRVMPDKQGVIRVRKDIAYACAAPYIDRTVGIPDCLKIEVTRRSVWEDDGTSCPTWKPRALAKKETTNG